MSGTASVSGLISGLDTDSIIDQLMQLQETAVTRIETKQSVAETELAAWQQVDTRVLALKTAALSLADEDLYNNKSVTSSDESIVTVSADDDAVAGVYYIKVNSLAKQHQVSTQGYADTDTASIGTGTFTIQVGDGESTDITITDSNDTLSGLKDAINKAGIGVTASIVNDGSADSPYRLVLTSQTSGTAGAVTITSGLSGGTGPVMSTIQEATQSSITLGSGSNALTILSDSNTVEDVIPGVTLNLQTASADDEITITVKADTSGVTSAIEDFVDQYNNVMDYINAQFEYDTDTEESGTLFADTRLMILQSSIRGLVSQIPTGLNQDINLMSEIGITTGTDDTLSIDSTELAKALSENLDQVKNLFAVTGSCTSSSVTFLDYGDSTVSSPSGGYAIEITQAATKSTLTAGVAQTEALGSDETLTINGVSVQLTAGMTQSAVVDAINKLSSETGVTAAATGADGTGTGNYLTFTATAYGSGRNIGISSTVSNGGTEAVANSSGIGTTEATVLNAVGESGTGVGSLGKDVAGTINGEECTGVGQILTGKSDNETTAGLRLRITAQTAGSYGSVVFTRGIADMFSSIVDDVTDEDDGVITKAEEALQKEIDAYDEDIADLDAYLETKRAYYEEMFQSMETALGNLQDTASYIESQTETLSSNWKSS